MSYPLGGLLISRNKVEGNQAVNLFGRNYGVGTTIEPLTPGGVLRLPTRANAQALRIRAGGNANDTATGTGARTVILSGLDANGNRIAEVLTTAGESASAFTSAVFWRLQEVIVSSVGAYDLGTTPTANAGRITIEDADGNEWGRISGSPFGRGRSQIGAYTVPTGFSLCLLDIAVSGPNNGRIDIVGMARANDLLNGTNRSFIVFFEKTRISGATEFTLPVPIGPFIGGTDIVFYAVSSQSPRQAAISCDGILTRGTDLVDLNGVTAEDFVVP